MFSRFCPIPDSRALLYAAGSVALIGMSGCTTMAPPVQQISQAESQVREAESIGAPHYAEQSYNMAQSRLEKAQAAFDEEEYLEAKRLAEKAAADATLAHVTTTNRKLKSAIEKLNQEIQSLEKELQQKS